MGDRELTMDRRARLASVVLIVYWVAFFIGSHWPKAPQLPSVPGFDKLLHVAAYAGLALLVAANYALRRPLNRTGYALMLGVLLAYGAVDEVLQIPVGRECSFADWLADVGGVVLGLVAFRAAWPASGRFLAAKESV